MKETFLDRNDGEGFDSVAWAYQTHAKRADNPNIQCAILYGNEDAPARIEFYDRNDYRAKPIDVWTEDADTFETYYWSGGHGGPHATLTAAVDHAVRYLQGMQRCDAVQIQSRGINPNTVLHVRKKEHWCGCSICPALGQTFIHVSKF